MGRELFISIVDRLLYIGAVLFAVICLWNIWKSFARGYVFINGKKALKAQDGLGFWLAIFTWSGIAVFFLYLVIGAFRDGSLP